MARAKRDSSGESTNKLVSCWVTESEHQMILMAVPEGESISEYARKILLKKVRQDLVSKKFGGRVVDLPPDEI